MDSGRGGLPGDAEGALYLNFGWAGPLTQMGWFFTKAALVTFGGAYAVLPYRSAQGRTPLLSIHWNLTVIGHTLADPAANLEYATMAHRFDRITSDPARMNGQPCIRGMRLTARRVVAAVALYPDREALKREYPELEDEDIRQALEYAAESIADEILALDAA